MKYYTYCYLGLDKKPYYIGKGSGDRAYVRHAHCDLPDRERIIILKRDLSEEEAFKHEIYMIDVFGLKVDGGLLLNRSRGGGRNAGWTHTDEAKKAIGDKNRGRAPLRSAIEKSAQQRQIPVKMLSPNGIEHLFESLTKAAEFIGCSRNSVCNVLAGRRYQIKGWLVI